MRRAVALAAGLLGLGWFGGPAGLDLQPWFQKAGVRSVAVLFVPKGQPLRGAEIDGWRQLRSRRGRDGLRLILVQEAPKAACARPSWADHVLCGAGKTFSGYRVPKDRLSAVVWGWQGSIIAQGTLRQSRRAIERAKPVVAVQLDGEGRRALGSAVKAALRGTGKLRPGRAPPGRYTHQLPDCAAGPRAAPPTWLLVGGVRAGRLRAALVDPSAGCAAARAEVGLAARAERDAAVELVGRLVFPLIQPAEAPDWGTSPSPERRHATPGGLVRPGAPVPAPVEALAPRAPPSTPRRAAPGRLVDPSRAGGGTSLHDFAARWVGVRHRLGGDDDTAIDGQHLTARLYREVYGVELGADISGQLASGPEVPIEAANPAAHLQPGDLLFFVSYAYLPRSVSVYLGGGKVLTSVVIRGVVIDDVPKSVPDYLYLVARRPLERAR